MKMDCNVIKDLMVLYDVGNCSEESEKLIKEHIETCDSCKRIWNEIGSLGMAVDWLRKPYTLSADEIQISNVYENGEYFGFKVTLTDGKVFVGNTYYSASSHQDGGNQEKGAYQINMGRDRFAASAENEAQSSWYIDLQWDVEKLYLKNADGTYTLLWQREDGISPLTDEIREDMERVERARQELQEP